MLLKMVFLLFVSVASSFVIPNIFSSKLRIQQTMHMRFDTQYYENLEDSSVMHTRKNAYIPRMGLESTLSTLGDSRRLLLTEYKTIFRLFPGLMNATKIQQWPDRDILPEEQRVINFALQGQTTTPVFVCFFFSFSLLSPFSQSILYSCCTTTW